MKLTADLINSVPAHLNAIKEYELDLRGHKIPMIENLAAAKNLHDSIDLCDNDIRVLGNFPALPRLQRLYIANNHVAHIDEKVHEWIPNLKTLILTNNEIRELVDIEPLRSFQSLEQLSLVNNPVMKKQHARLWIIWRIPQLRNLNFQRIKQKERQEATVLFETRDGELTSLAKSILQVESSKTFEPDQGIPTTVTDQVAAPSAHEPSQAEKDNAELLEQIKQSMELQEMKGLEDLMRQGYVPGELANRARESRTS
ncbi:U2 snRNP complex subunit [Spiromyces aspiralis]|uniref:U2 snRNP complex subunit n=1 Tax=Spiromyces aspiralis TaxID=68401 RepID=A0ACC1HSW1_9FUNG|nr:U2 snRNP complex subunit [Spiromyces aspiralis]